MSDATLNLGAPRKVLLFEALPAPFTARLGLYKSVSGEWWIRYATAINAQGWIPWGAPEKPSRKAATRENALLLAAARLRNDLGLLAARHGDDVLHTCLSVVTAEIEALLSPATASAEAPQTQTAVETASMTHTDYTPTAADVDQPLETAAAQAATPAGDAVAAEPGIPPHAAFPVAPPGAEADPTSGRASWRFTRGWPDEPSSSAVTAETPEPSAMVPTDGVGGAAGAAAERQILHLDPALLIEHPVLAAMPALAAADPRYLAMQAAWRESGIIDPVYAVKQGEVWAVADGRHRLRYARANGLPTIPVIEVTEAEVPQVIMRGAFGRAHSTKSQRAYLAAPYMKGAYEASAARRLANLRKGAAAPAAPFAAAPTMASHAESLGISEELLRQALQLHAIFAKDPDVKAEWEPKILGEDHQSINLGAALAGIASQTAAAAAPAPARNSRLHKIASTWGNFVKSAGKWVQLSHADQEAAETAIEGALTAADPALVDALIRCAQAAAKTHRKAAKLQAASAAQLHATAVPHAPESPEL